MEDIDNLKENMSFFNEGKGYYVENSALSELNTELRNRSLRISYSLKAFYSCNKRLETFQTWSKLHPLKPEQLAQAGFCFTGFGDICLCPWCEKEVDRWTLLDEPFAKHKEVSSLVCPYLSYIFPQAKAQKEPVDTYSNLVIEEDTQF